MHDPRKNTTSSSHFALTYRYADIGKQTELNKDMMHVRYMCYAGAVNAKLELHKVFVLVVLRSTSGCG